MLWLGFVNIWSHAYCRGRGHYSFLSSCIYTEQLSLGLLSNYICIRVERIHLACWEMKYLDTSECEAKYHLCLQCSPQESKSISLYELSSVVQGRERQQNVRIGKMPLTRWAELIHSGSGYIKKEAECRVLLYPKKHKSLLITTAPNNSLAPACVEIKQHTSNWVPLCRGGCVWAETAGRNLPAKFLTIYHAGKEREWWVQARGGSTLGGKTLVSTNDICNIILSEAGRLGRDSLLKCGRGSDGGIYGKLYRKKRKRAKRRKMLDGGHGSKALLTLGTHSSKLLSLIKTSKTLLLILTRMMWQNCITW